MLSEFCCVSSFQKNFVFVIIFFYQNICITLGHFFHRFCDFIHRISIYFPAKFNLGFYLIPFCNSYISHIICNSHNPDVAAFNNANSCSHPGGNSLLNFLIIPEANNDFAFYFHTAYNMSIFSVTMSRLVFIHKVHINTVIRNLSVKLCMQMKQRFSVLL